MALKKSSIQLTMKFSDQNAAENEKCRIIPFIDAATQRARDDAVRRVAAAGVFSVGVPESKRSKF